MIGIAQTGTGMENFVFLISSKKIIHLLICKNQLRYH